MLSPLTREILMYQQTGIGLNKVVKLVATHVYSFPGKKHNLSEDDRSEFLCRFYPRIPSMIFRFKYQGKPFESYLNVTLKWQLKTFISRKLKANTEQKVFTCRNFWATEEERYGAVAEIPPSFSPKLRETLQIGKNDKIKDPAISKRLLYLTLKGLTKDNISLVEHVANLTGYDRKWLFHCLEALENKRELKISRLKKLQSKRNSQFFKIYRIHRKLLHESEPAKKLLLADKLLIEKKRLQLAISEIRSIPLAPTHQDIADVLKVPKGSIDSGIYYLKNALRKIGIEYRQSA